MKKDETVNAEQAEEKPFVDETRSEVISKREDTMVTTRSTARPLGKLRSPVMVIIYSILTLGIYSIIYHYCLFDEMKNYRGQGWGGGLFLIFCFLFPIPLVAIPWLLPAYVGRMYAEDGKERPVAGPTGFWCLLPVVGGIVWLFKVQNNLNLFWEEKGAIA